MKKIIFLSLLLSLTISGCATNTSTPINDNTNPKQNTTNENKKPDDKLNLSGQALTKVPDYVFLMVNLEELNVSNNQLAGAIQAEINKLANLKVLLANDNQMTGVPAEVGQLKKLQVLDLSNNKLTGLPYELGNLQNLQLLNISGNNYSQADLDIISEKLPASTVIIK